MAEYKAYISLCIWVILLLVMSSAIGIVTGNKVDMWYQTLQRSPLTPPGYVFGPVWTLLYIMIAIAGWMIWRSDTLEKKQFIQALYIAQLILNWCWTPLFFGYQLVGVALICLFSITVLVGIIIAKTYQAEPIIAGLLVPYFLWLSFAGYLNVYIWLYN